VRVTAPDGVYYDPYDVQINADPYVAFRGLREDAPLYYNEQYDFYALSRFADVDRAIFDHETFSSARGAIIELIKANIDMPPGVLIFEDPPIHDVHRKLLARMFTPRKINDLEPKIREFCARSLDPLIGADRFDFVADLGAQMPMRVIGMLLGVPEEYQEAARDLTNAQMRTEAGKPMTLAADRVNTGEFFAEFIDWRAEHPSGDIMTDLLNVEFEDEAGITRRLSRDELFTYISVVSGAGNETTTRLIGWAGKVLAEPRPATGTGREPRADPPGHRGTAALRTAGSARGTLRDPRRHVLRADGAGGQRHDDAHRSSQSRSPSIPVGRRRFRHSPGTAPASRLQRRHPLLPRLGTGAVGGADRARRDLEALPQMGGRPQLRHLVSDIHRAWLGGNAGGSRLSKTQFRK
jgi:hypothetical protein